MRPAPTLLVAILLVTLPLLGLASPPEAGKPPESGGGPGPAGPQEGGPATGARVEAAPPPGGTSGSLAPDEGATPPEGGLPGAGDGPSSPSTPSSSPSSRDSPTFTNVSDEAGLGGVGGNFLAWGDYDRDGYEDILVNGRRLFRNSGPPGFAFTEETGAAGLSGSGAANGVWGDYDNDGYLDFFGGNWDDFLYHNNGDGTFTDVAQKAGIMTPEEPTTAGGWGDYDNDGDLDLYTTGGEWVDEEGTYHHYKDTFFRNDGDGTFTDVTVAAGMDTSDDPRYGRGVAWCDYDKDGDLDVYISNYRITANYLWRNNGDGTFTDTAEYLNVAGEPTNRLGNVYYGHTVGSAWADYDNDGDFDLWATNLAHKDVYRGPICDDSELYQNNIDVWGEGDFTNVREESGIPTKNVGGGEDELMVGVAWGDYDNDGWEDLFLPQIYNDPEYAYSYLYHNNGDGTFTDVSDDVGVKVWNTYAGCWCDYDRDGDLDLLTSGKGEADPAAPHDLHLYRNDGAGVDDWLQVDIVGRTSNSDAVGATAFVIAREVMRKQVEGGMGSHGMKNSHILHFGLGRTYGANDTPPLLVVTWPSGIEVTLEDIKPNQRMVLEEPEAYHDWVINYVRPPQIDPDADEQFEEEYQPGDTLELECCVQNVGTFQSPATNVAIYLVPDDSMMPDEVEDLNETMTSLTLGPLDPHERRYPMLEFDLNFAPGTYTFLALVPPDPGNESDTANNGLYFNITIAEPPPHENEPPVAVLWAEPSSALVGEEVLFNATGSYDDVAVVSYYYDFGDGEAQGWVSSATAGHTYYEAGQYTATLEVKDTDGNTSLEPAEVTLSVATETGNHPPNLISLVAGDTELTPDNSTTITATAEDEDGDELTYIFKATAGELGEPYYPMTGGMAEVQWTAPDKEGDCVITCSVSDGELESLSRTVTIAVVSDEEEEPGPGRNYYPVIEDIAVDPEEPAVGSSVRVEVTAADPNDDPLTYEYEVNGGEILAAGEVGFWEVPDEAGTYKIKVAVEDGRGGRDSDRLYVSVVKPLHAPAVTLATTGTAAEEVPSDGETEVTLTALVGDDNGLYDIASVEADLTAIGLEVERMRDDGEGGDTIADNGVYTLVFTVPTGLAEGKYQIPVTATDVDGLTGSGSTYLRVAAYEGGDDGGSGGDESAPGLTTGAAVLAGLVAATAVVAMGGRRRRE